MAIISSVFIILASLTGSILAFEPITNTLTSQPIDTIENVTIAETIAHLESKYDEVLMIKRDENDCIITSVITYKGESETFYINPISGEKLGYIIEKAPIYKFATNLHRSLFLKSTGRFIIGLVSFFLFLITITGMLLIAKRQGGLKRFFSKIIKENFEQYYHVVIGRVLLIPILIIALTGVYLSLEKFSLLPNQEITHFIQEEELNIVKIPITEFDIFKAVKILDIESIEFPFSEDIEDYFYVKLKDKEIIINQYSGNVVSEKRYPLVQIMSHWSLILHTGRGNLLWSIVLLFACLGLLFFIYSGFTMTLKRSQTKGVIKNKFDKDESEFIILVGSETGTTYNFAVLFYNALISEEKRVHMIELNKYSTYNKAKHIVVFTATYGEGEAPVNAKKFEALLDSTIQNNNMTYAVVGFGSLLYPAYCKYAIVVDSLLQLHQKFIPKLPLYKINNQSFEAFSNWSKLWSNDLGFDIHIKMPTLKSTQAHIETFEVKSSTKLNCDNSFLLELKPQKKVKFKSGDLLSVKLKENEAARIYSIGKKDGNILLSIKRHEQGLCSNYLNNLNKNDKIKASIQQNKSFRFPSNAKAVVMIANGTGIAPFLGMINENKKRKNIHLFWGGRTKASFDMYEEVIYKAFDLSYLKEIRIAYSQEQEHRYVQNLVRQDTCFIAKHLKDEGVIMICGSIAMQNQVLETLHHISMSILNVPLSVFESKEQIKMDCY
ncbi:FAD-binding oxidoreductase [Flavobacteriales bacterium 33_180_T64]|nr:FAD-binding oxidoreductase [Flavobacteriales bacterium 33_180_T64]